MPTTSVVLIDREPAFLKGSSALDSHQGIPWFSAIEFSLVHVIVVKPLLEWLPSLSVEFDDSKSEVGLDSDEEGDSS